MPPSPKLIGTLNVVTKSAPEDKKNVLGFDSGNFSSPSDVPGPLPWLTMQEAVPGWSRLEPWLTMQQNRALFPRWKKMRWLQEVASTGGQNLHHGHPLPSWLWNEWPKTWVDKLLCVTFPTHTHKHVLLGPCSNYTCECLLAVRKMKSGEESHYHYEVQRNYFYNELWKACVCTFH